MVNAQQTITGTVLNEKNKPIAGVNVFIDGTYDGTSTDEKGNFSFQTNALGNQILVISFLDFNTLRVTINATNFKNQTFKLKENVNVLDAVVITAGSFSAGEKSRVSVLKPATLKIILQVNTLLHSVEESIQWFNCNTHPDLIFLDIQLSDGLSFEIFESTAIKSAVIFTNAYDEYALRAFKLNSIDYLLKPIDEDDLAIAISKFKNQFQQNVISNLDFEAIKRMLINPVEKSYKKRFNVKVGHQLKVIAIEEVECFYSENKGTYLHTLDNRNYPLDTTLEQLETELNPQYFYRVSRKFIVQMDAIKEIQIFSNSRLKVILPTYKEDEVIVAREKVTDFKDWLG